MKKGGRSDLQTSNLTGHRAIDSLNSYNGADIEEDVENAEIILNVGKKKPSEPEDDNKIESVNSNDQPSTSGTATGNFWLLYQY